MRIFPILGFECLDCLQRHIGVLAIHRARFHKWHRGHPMALGAGVRGKSVKEVREKLVRLREERFQRIRAYEKWHTLQKQAVNVRRNGRVLR